jgi:hypothetical protein
MSTRRTTESARTAESASDKTAPRRRAAPTKADAATTATVTGAVSETARRVMIEQGAYLRAERRGFAPGGELEDWMAAEAEVDALLRAGNGRPPQ